MSQKTSEIESLDSSNSQSQTPNATSNNNPTKAKNSTKKSKKSKGKKDYGDLVPDKCNNETDANGNTIPVVLKSPIKIMTAPYINEKLLKVIASNLRKKYPEFIKSRSITYLAEMLRGILLAYIIRNNCWGIRGLYNTYKSMIPGYRPIKLENFSYLVHYLSDPELLKETLKIQIEEAMELLDFPDHPVKENTKVVLIQADGTNFYGSQNKTATGDPDPMINPQGIAGNGFRYSNSNVCKDKPSRFSIISQFCLTIKNYIIYWQTFVGGTNEHKQATIVLDSQIKEIKKVFEEISESRGVTYVPVFTADAGVGCDNVKAIIEEHGFEFIAKEKITAVDSIIKTIKGHDEFNISEEQIWHNHDYKVRKVTNTGYQITSLDKKQQRKRSLPSSHLIHFNKEKYVADIEELLSKKSIIEQITDSNKADITIKSRAASLAKIDLQEGAITLDKKRYNTEFNRAGFYAYYISCPDTILTKRQVHFYVEAYFLQAIQELSTKNLKDLLDVRPFWSKTWDGVVGQICLAILSQNLIVSMSMKSTNTAFRQLMTQLKKSKKSYSPQQIADWLSDPNAPKSFKKLMRLILTELGLVNKEGNEKINLNKVIDEFIKDIEALENQSISTEENNEESQDVDKKNPSDKTEGPILTKVNSSHTGDLDRLSISPTYVNKAIRELGMSSKVQKAGTTCAISSILRKAKAIVRGDGTWDFAIDESASKHWEQLSWMFQHINS